MFSIFTHKPGNYQQIDNVVSRSAQPDKDNLKWLKKHGITDVISFRTETGLNHYERSAVEDMGMHFHNIPTDARHPQEESVGKFLDIVDGIERHGGKAHIHCAAGSDRTGMYSWIYKQRHGIGEMAENRKEMLKFGHQPARYPMLINWITEYLYKGFRP